MEGIEGFARHKLEAKIIAHCCPVALPQPRIAQGSNARHDRLEFIDFLLNLFCRLLAVRQLGKRFTGLKQSAPTVLNALIHRFGVQGLERV